ncbi:MAG: acyltransferase [Flavipsychrobacter sp.]|nr:acyltransferase [Flavipsychrobacter sp.]
MSATAAKQERFHFLDGLRGIASLMIVFHHAFTANIVKLLIYLKLPAPGYYLAYFTQSGVELFFVLSGIVLLRPYLRKMRDFKIGTYFLRRAKRILPPYWAALIIGAFVSMYINAFPTWYSKMVFHLYFQLDEILKEALIINFNGEYYNLAWWSLGIEILFYLLVPVFLFIFPSYHKLNNVRVTVMITVTIALSLALQLFLTRYYPHLYDSGHVVSNIYQSVCYPVCFLMGMLLAAKDFDKKAAQAFIISGIALILISWFYIPIVHSGFGLLYAGIIILSFKVESFRRWLSRPLMIWIGERSYSIFLIHFSMFYLTDNFVAQFTSRGAAYGILSRAIGVPLAIFVAMLLFHFVERRQAHGLVTGHIFWPWQVKKLDI